MEHVFLKGSLALGPALCSVVGGCQPHVTMPKIEGRTFSTSPLNAAGKSSSGLTQPEHEALVRIADGAVKVFAGSWPGLRRLYNDQGRILQLATSLRSSTFHQGDWTGTSGLTDYMALREAVGLAFYIRQKTVEKIINAALEGTQPWDSEKLGPIDAARLLAQAHEQRFLNMAAEVISTINGYDALVVKRLKRPLSGSRTWEQHTVYASDMPNGMWPVDEEGRQELLTAMAQSIEDKLTYRKMPVFLSARFSKSVDSRGPLALLWPNRVDLA